MSTNRKFTEEEMKILRENPNIVSVSPTKLTYSLVFKQKAVAESEKKGMTAVRIFALAGLTLELLGKPRITAAMKSFKKEAACLCPHMRISQVNQHGPASLPGLRFHFGIVY
ncbi:hypothetical protein BXY41_10346 [Lacrimispora xylanisolvens]|uniref:Uncharacterized protein n=1 Tax=Lacrimispora xylanisolvens TaxID=384636 RepID=A0A2S6HV72_9FIRM|nr:HTH domain-containing protein [Hungatella xylanolytica]PPK81839.1 hypothetical protein BXY41_10346 [Hungatella xylanolytica]